MGWSSWSAWSECNEDAERIRYRKCLKTNPESHECQGNESDIRVCNAGNDNGKIKEHKYLQYNHFNQNLIFLSEVVQTAGVSSASTYLMLAFIVLLACSNVFIYMFMKRRIAMPRDIKAMGSPCFDSFPNQYSSLPTKDDRPKVKRQSSFSATNGGSATIKLLSNGNGTLTKSNNVNTHHTPKVLAKSFVENDTATIKRNSHALNNIRPLRSIEDDKF